MVSVPRGKEEAMTEHEDLDRAVMGVVANVSNFPEKVQARLLGQNMRPLGDRIIEAVLAAGYRKQEPDEWEYGQSEVLQDGTVAFGPPVETLEEAIRSRDIDRINYPWPEELGVGRRRKAGPWEPVPENGDET